MNLTPKEFAGARVVVMGLGRFGGGIGVARYLAQQQADVLVTDLHTADELRNSLAQLDGLPIRYRLGSHQVDDFAAADLVVVNPAVDPKGNPYLRAATNQSVPLTSELQIVLAGLPNPQRVIGITGTAGKSTVTSMVGHILNQSLLHAHAYTGGNLGGSLLDQLDAITPDDWVVLEVSSFMLQMLAQDQWSPHIAVVTNLSPNHLDRHGSYEAYVQAK